MTRLLDAVLGFIQFGGSPDHQPLYPKVRRWLLEVDEEKNGVCREIGLGEGDLLLFAAPMGRNLGWWAGPDLDYDLTDEQVQPIDARQFEELWSKCSSSKSGVPSKPR